MRRRQTSTTTKNKAWMKEGHVKDYVIKDVNLKKHVIKVSQPMMMYQARVGRHD